MKTLKKILVPTDFSDCAYYASDLAVKMAAQLGGVEVHFYTRVHVPAQWAELAEGGNLRRPETILEFEEMKKNFALLRKRYEDNKSRIITSYSQGDVVEVVSNYINKEEIDLVLMGSSGADGMKEWLIGTNSQRIVRHAHCPVLVIKHPIEPTSFRNIIFASDFKEEARVPFERLIDFAKPFGAHIHLLNIAAYPKFELAEEDKVRMQSFERMCWSLPCTVHGSGDINIELGIKHFAKEMQADMIAIANYGEPLLKRIFRGSISESLVNHFEIPILTLNTKEQKTWVVLSDSFKE